ncbi:MAG: metal ABC transporter substrate-binding protein, partial [Asgard group archaeon]|nr:metal ABC transporter substrate-binding protein [Asgard group archaeon]
MIKKSDIKNIYSIIIMIILAINPLMASSFSTTFYIEDNIITVDPISVVTSISIVADFANQVGEGLFTAESIVTGSENPHIYEPTPSEIEMVADADIFIRMGIDGLEPWVQSVLDANPGVPVLELINSSMIEYDEIIEADNPHVWMDPNNAKTMVNSIYQEIITIDSANNETYFTNKEEYLIELDDLLISINEAYTELNGTKVIVHHPAFKYLLDLLGIIRLGAIEQREGSEPSPAHINNLIELINTEGVDFIISQPQLDDEVVNQIARDTNTEIVEITPLLGILGLVNYTGMMEYNLEALQNPQPPSNISSQWTMYLL